MDNKNIILALCEAKKEFKPIVKDKENPFFKSKYADLDNYLDATQESLCKYSLFVSQTVLDKNLVTTIHYAHSDKTIESKIEIKETKTPQELGSLLTYLRRYAYAAILGLASEDDDANESSKDSIKKPEPKKQTPVIDKIVNEQVDNSVLPRIEKKFKTLPEAEKLTFLANAQKKLETENQDAVDYQKAFDWIVAEKNKIIVGAK